MHAAAHPSSRLSTLANAVDRPRPTRTALAQAREPFMAAAGVSRARAAPARPRGMLTNSMVAGDSRWAARLATTRPAVKAAQ